MIRVGIVGGSGFTGGELIRLLLSHPEVSLVQVTSERLAGKPIGRSHPNLRKRSELTFTSSQSLEPVDLLFLGLPHGRAMNEIDRYIDTGARIIDLSGDFRLSSPESYERWYGEKHTRPDLLPQFVYGIPELHREQMQGARFISSAGCNATATILGLFPLYRAGVVERGRTVVEVKVGSSEGGASSSDSSHHPIRSGCVRSFMPTGHRHTGEVLQELSLVESNSSVSEAPLQIHFSATALDMVRGVVATAHVFLTKDLADRDIWKIYREAYGKEPFVRIVKEAQGNYRFPEPKILAGTNMCDIGFERDPHSNRLVIVSAIDNLMKGAAGQAVQAMNIAFGFEETLGLDFPGLHPI